MRQQAMSSKMVFNRPIPVNRLVSAIADSESIVLDFDYLSTLDIQRPRSILKNTDAAHTVLASLLSVKITVVLTCTNSHHLETLTNTTPCRSVQGVKVQRPISRNITKALPTVRILHQYCLRHTGS